jgi:transglutaminase-like putative cysteine protease
MIYDIRLVTFSTYESDVPFARHVLRLKPTDRPGQRVLAFSMEVEPPSSALQGGRDFFGNEATAVACIESHRRFTARATARVEVDPFKAPDGDGPAWEEIAALALTLTDLSPQSPAHFIYPSRLAGVSDKIGAYAAESFSPGAPIRACAIDLMRRLHRDIVYDSDATNATTRPEEAFALRRGVCQDIAHIMISAMRALGLPIAYVSGFIRTLPPPGQPRRDGADSMHAWVSVWCGPDIGWLALDPTNALEVSDEHVVVAVGRDYADVAPLDGVIITAGAQGAVDVVVDMAPVA